MTSSKLFKKRLAAFSRDCVKNGDMTPTAARMLVKLADEECDDPAVRRPDQAQLMGDVTINLEPTGEIWLGIGDVASRPLTENEMTNLMYSLEQFRKVRQGERG